MPRGIPNTCPLCKNPFYSHSANVKRYCYFHFHIDLFQHNQDLNHLGIVSFAFTMFPSRMKKEWGIAKMHREMLWEFLYDEAGWQREDRAHVIATFRGGAKTTWFSLIIPTYLICMNSYGIFVGDYKLPRLDYIVLKSKVGKSSGKNLYNIQNSLSSREITGLFGDLRPTIKSVKAKEGKDTSNLLITGNGNIVESLGINQQIRGTNILGKRPKVVIYDDPETGENTKTPERRKNNEMDLLDETWGAVDEQDGRVVYIGNMVHEDCLLKKLLNNESWKKKFYTLTYKDSGGKEHITWTGKYTWQKIAKIKRFYESHPQLGLVAYYRNYYNINKTDVNPIINKITNWEFLRYGNQNFIRYFVNNQFITETCYITVGYDAAVTQRASGSKTSILVLAQTSSGKKLILGYKYNNFDTHDRYMEGMLERERPVVALEPEHISKIFKFGGIEESVRMIVKYHADGFAMGTEGQQLGFYNDVVDLLQRIGNHCATTPIPAAGKDASSKVTRLRDWILRQFEANVFYICGDAYELLSELETFPQSKLDILDSLYYADRAQMKPVESTYGGSPPEHPREIIMPEVESEEAWVIM